MQADNQDTTNLNDLSFEEALSSLEEITRNLEGGRVKLDEAVAAYTKGMELKKICEKRLSDAKLKIEQISTGNDGSLSTKDFNVQ